MYIWKVVREVLKEFIIVFLADVHYILFAFRFFGILSFFKSFFLIFADQEKFASVQNLKNKYFIDFLK